MATHSKGVKPNPGGYSGRPPVRESPNPQALAVRRQKALELRIKGHTLREIAEQVGVSASVCRHDIKNLIAANLSDLDIAGARALEEERLDKILKTATSIAEGKGPLELRLKAIDRVVRIINMRAQLLGLNAPVRHDVTVTERTQQDIELEEMINEAKARNAGVADQLAAEVGSDDPAGA